MKRLCVLPCVLRSWEWSLDTHDSYFHGHACDSAMESIYSTMWQLHKKYRECRNACTVLPDSILAELPAIRLGACLVPAFLRAQCLLV